MNHLDRALRPALRLRRRGGTRIAAMAALAAASTLGAGCGDFFKKQGAQITVDVFHDGAKAFAKEHDIEFARAAAYGNLKVFEGLREVVPDNPTLLTMIAKSFSEFAFAFLEDDLDQLDPLDEEAYAPIQARAVDFYQRAFGAAVHLAELDEEGFGAALDGPIDRLEAVLAHTDADDAHALFWVGSTWIGQINLSLEDPAALLGVPKAEAIIRRAVELDEAYENGLGHVYLASLKAAVPASLGGDAQGAARHFARAIELSGGRFYMTRVLEARYVHAGVAPDRAAFVRTLEEVLAAPADAAPELRLANEIAKVRARRLLDRQEDFFEGDDEGPGGL